MCSKFGILEMVIWLREANVNGMVNSWMNVDVKVCKKYICERIRWLIDKHGLMVLEAQEGRNKYTDENMFQK